MSYVDRPPVYLEFCMTHEVGEPTGLGQYCVQYEREMDWFDKGGNTRQPEPCNWVTLNCVQIVDIASELV